MKLHNLKEVKEYCFKALKITTHEKTYINEISSWDHTIYDLLSICYFYENRINDAIYYIDKALEISPNNERLLKNKEVFFEYFNNIKSS